MTIYTDTKHPLYRIVSMHGSYIPQYHNGTEWVSYVFQIHPQQYIVVCYPQLSSAIEYLAFRYSSLRIERGTQQ